MLISRREFGCLAVGGLLVARVPGTLAATDQYAPVPKEDSQFGSYTQAWFLDSFLEFADELEEAADRGKRLALLWELDGCPYCREMHLVNFANPEIRDYVEANFEIVQLDIRGAREVVNFDGKAMSEGKLARTNGVRYTPTIQFFPKTLSEMSGRSGKAMEVARMPEGPSDPVAQRVVTLKVKLQEAVDREEYEEAAKFRDEIGRLELEKG